MMKTFILAAILAILPLSANCAAHISENSFPLDWQLTCDNTRTCRAAGYHDDEENALPMSVLLTRKAGPGEQVKGQLMIGHYQTGAEKIDSVSRVEMRVDGKALGPVAIDQRTWVGQLSAAQVRALLAALAGETSIEWTNGSKHWRLSHRGAAAALLQMDALQGRIGTVGALIRKGPASEAKVLPPLAAPVVHAAPVARALPGDAQLFQRIAAPVREAVLATLGPDPACDLLGDDNPDAPIGISRLAPGKLLLDAPCWRAAYNSGQAYWVANDMAPYRPEIVTTDGTDYEAGEISKVQAGRGLGDCISTMRWVWDGKAFVHAETSETGLCRLVAPGGAWTLPTYTSDVRRPR